MTAHEESDDQKIKRKLRRSQDRSEALKKILEELEKRRPTRLTRRGKSNK